ncbi:hypothetical protein AB0G67_39530 [Streptomyces sp. NPDC021056]|uniref:hypothetical protein n=1 Tax=Streptomyces sp. NPDC021056 TaxID=3155012 RepID=UPI0033FFC90A
MAELTSRRKYDVDFGGFALQDADDRHVPVRFPEGFQRGALLAALPGRLDFTSAAHTHTVAFTVEVWDAEPPLPLGDWEAAATVDTFTSSGQLRARSVAGGPMPDRIPLADHSSTWSVRVVCTGRAAMAEHDEEDLAEGIEQYLARFWPAA